MKPKKLMMSAFGSFANYEEIDFTEIEKEPVFLICGPTGAGKTTIFDAITYALFGDASGDGRKPENMRSDFAGPETLTMVELTFEVRGKEYHILRQPRQTRVKKSGEGLTEISPKVELRYQAEDGEVLVFTKQAEVNEKIKEIIGLGIEQFKQIILLPQGEFRKLLTADSRQREEILREIFDAEQYLNLQLALKEDADRIEKRIKEQKVMQRHWMVQLQTEPYEGELSEEQQEALARLLTQEEIDRTELFDAILLQNQKDLHLAELKKQSAAERSVTRDNRKEQLFYRQKENEKFSQLQTITEQRNFLESQREEMDKKQERLKKVEKAIHLKPYAEYLEKTQRQREELEQEVSEIARSGEQLAQTHQQLLPDYQSVTSVQWQQELEKLEKEMVELEMQIPMLNDLRHLKELYSGLAKEVKHKEVLLNQKAEEKIALQEENHKIRLFLSDNDGLEVTVLSLEQRCADLEKIVNLCQKLETIKKQRDSIALEFSLLSKKQEQVETRYQLYQEKLKQDHVHALQKDLSDGEICPVCHNVYRIQVLSGSAGENQNWDGIEEEREAFLKEKELVFAKKIEWEEKLRIAEEQHKEWQRSGVLEKSDTTESELTAIQTREQEELEKARKLLAKVRAERERQVALEGRLEKLEEQLQKAQADLQEKKLELERTAGEGKNLKKQILPSYYERNDLQSINELASRLNELKEQRQNRRKKAQELEEKYQEVLRLESENKALKERAEKQKQELQKQENQELQNFTKYLKDNDFVDKLQWQEYVAMASEMEFLEEEIKQFHTGLLKITEAQERLQAEVSITSPYDLSELQESIAQDQSKIEKDLRESAYYFNRAKENEKIYTVLKEMETDREKLLSDYRAVSKIAKVANGDNAKKLTFERYVLAAFLDDVLEVANYRLEKMTGRYTLKRKEEVTHRGKQSGLELEVFDRFTGKTRAIGTLSGGESFKTALSLALGLSEVVSTYSGGIEMDTLFIDEGFGTLDPESLDAAIDCILDLQAKGKMIGIISHVAELKERIPAKLEVIQTVKGSYTKYRVGDLMEK